MRRERKDINGTHFIKDQDGCLRVKKREVCDVWRNHFERISNETSDAVLPDVPPTEGPIGDFTLEEVKDAVKLLKKGKAPGPSGVTGDMLQFAGDTAAKELLVVFQRILRTGKCPQQWSHSHTVALFKGKGDPLSCNTHRGL